MYKLLVIYGQKCCSLCGGNMTDKYYKTVRTVLIVDSCDKNFVAGVKYPVYMDNLTSTWGIFDDSNEFRPVRMLQYHGVDWEYIKEKQR